LEGWVKAQISQWRSWVTQLFNRGWSCFTPCIDLISCHLLYVFCFLQIRRAISVSNVYSWKKKRTRRGNGKVKTETIMRRIRIELEGEINKNLGEF
jgi:hypothetical protein